MRKVDAAARDGADSVEIWGTGTPLREFMHVDDLADALVFLLKEYDEAEHINVGTGEEVTIAELAQRMMGAVGYRGELRFDSSKPDGTPRKVMDCSRAWPRSDGGPGPRPRRRPQADLRLVPERTRQGICGWAPRNQSFGVLYFPSRGAGTYWRPCADRYRPSRPRAGETGWCVPPETALGLARSPSS